jgi:hypothetical protein
MRAISAYSSTELPQMLTMTVAKLLGDEAAHSDALQADGVDHAGGCLGDARRLVSVPFVQEQALHDHGSQCGQVHRVGVFDAVAEAAAGGHERVDEAQRANGRGQIHQCTRRHQAIAWPSNTGPDRQERTKWARPSLGSRTLATQL